MLTVYNGRTYEWEPPLAPKTLVTVNGERTTIFAAFAGDTVGGVLLDVEAAHPEMFVPSFNPRQVRIPKGNDAGGEWLDVPGGVAEELVGPGSDDKPAWAGDLEACATEDSDNCYWDASKHGNGEGQSFIARGGKTFPVPDEVANPGPAPDWAKGLTPCLSEDSDNCYWDAQARSNGKGDSFIVENGKVTYIEKPKAPARPSKVPSRATAAETLTFAGGNPSQARVPKGNGERSGRWVDVVGSVVRGLGQSLTGMNPKPGDPPGGNQLIESGNPLPRLKGNHDKVTGADFNKDDPTKEPFGEGPASKANQLYDSATAAEPKITRDMQDMLSEDQELTGLAFRIKEPTSLATKIRGDMKDKTMTADEAAANMWDVNRYTAMSSTENLSSDISTSLASLEADGYQVFQNKNTWGFPDPNNPYQGVNIKLISPDGQQIELQFHTPESWAVKEKQHVLYNKQKTMTKGSPEWLAAAQEMKKMSEDLPVPPGIENIR